MAPRTKSPQPDLFSVLAEPCQYYSVGGDHVGAEAPSEAAALADQSSDPAKVDPSYADLFAKAAVERYLSDAEVAARIGVSRPTIWRWLKAHPDFPRPKRLSPGTTRWALSELIAYEARRPAWKPGDPTLRYKSDRGEDRQ